MRPKKYPYTGSKINKVTTIGIGARELVEKTYSNTFSQLSNNMTTLQSFTSEFQKYSDTRRKEQKYI